MISQWESVKVLEMKALLVFEMTFGWSHCLVQTKIVVTVVVIVDAMVDLTENPERGL